MTETGVDGDSLYTELMNITGGNPTAQGIAKLYGDFSVKSYRKYAPDGVVHVGGDTGLGTKTDTSYLFSQGSEEKVLAMAKTMGITDKINPVPVEEVFANPEDMASQGFNPGDMVYNLPVSKKIVWGSSKKLHIANVDIPNIMASPNPGFSDGEKP